MSAAVAAFASSFGNRDLRRLELGAAGSELGTWAYAVAVAVYAYREDGVTAVGLLCLVRWGLAGVLSPWLALLADRLPRRWVMVGSDLAGATLLGAMAAGVALGAPPLLVYALAVLVSVAACPFFPAQAAILPSLARTPGELTSANVVLSTVASAAMFVGPALAGLLLTVAGPAVVLAVVAGTSIWSAACIARISAVGHPSPEAAAEPVSTALLGGFRAIARDANVRLLVGLVGSFSFVCGVIQVLVVVLALRVLDAGPGGVGWLNAALGIGGVAGALAASALAGGGRLARALALGFIFFGLPLVLTAVAGRLDVVLVLFVVNGLAGTVIDVAGMTLLQRAASADVLGRVFGVLGTVVYATLAAGAGVGPVLVSGLGPRGAFVVTGALLPVLLVPLWPRLRRIDETAGRPTGALDLLQAIPIFELLPEPVLERLAANAVELTVPADSTVVEQGAAGDHFYVIAGGRASVEVDGAVVREIGAGDFFGEIALLRDVPRTATVRALDELRLFALEREAFLAAVTGHTPSRATAERVVVGRLSGAPI